MPKKQKKVIPTFETLGQDYEAFFNGVADKSDRDYALAICAYLEDILNSMFRKLLLDEGKPNGEFIQNLMTGYGPLSGFSARIDMAYALGWIGPKMRTNLRTIKEIRNQFAHQYRIDSFEHPDIKAECEKLRAAKPINWNMSTRDEYKIIAVRMVSELTLIALNLKRPSEAKDFEIVGHYIV